MYVTERVARVVYGVVAEPRPVPAGDVLDRVAQSAGLACSIA